jgi:hypothetical protein
VSALLVTARRRPGAILGVFAVEALAAWMLAAPWAETFARVLGGHPDGDRAFWWDPGLRSIIDLEARLGSVLAALFAATSIGLAVYAVLSVLTVGALIAALADPALSLRRAIGRGAETYFRMLGIGAVSVFAQAVVFVLVGVIPAYALSLRFSDPRHGAVVAIVMLCVGVAAVALIRAAADLARARVVVEELSALDAFTATVRDRPAILRQTLASAPRWIASLGLVGYAAALTTAASSVFVIFLVHQLVAVLRVALRASVLARAVRNTTP